MSNIVSKITKSIENELNLIHHKKIRLAIAISFAVIIYAISCNFYAGGGISVI